MFTSKQRITNYRGTGNNLIVGANYMALALPRFGEWENVFGEEFEDPIWQDRNAITRMSQLRFALDNIAPPDVLNDIEAGLAKVGMSIRLNPYVMSLIDWSNAANDPIRRQFLPMRSELEDDHPCLTLDSLEEQNHSPVSGLVHRYPDKALFLVTSLCPVYCQYCTRSYAVGLDTELVQKNHLSSARHWGAAIDYIREHKAIEDVVVSGGDVARLKAADLRELGQQLLAIDHIRRIRFATKAVSVQPMKFLHDEAWVKALFEIVESARASFKHVCIHTHFNHPSEITPLVERAMRRLHQNGVMVRNQTVLLRGVNDDADVLRALIKGLGRVNIHPYYVYLCDMVRGTEHFRVPIGRAQQLEKEVRGTTAGFNTPLFVVDTPGGKRDVHSTEFRNIYYGVSAFVSPNVAAQRVHYYFDPFRSLTEEARAGWARFGRDKIIARSAPPRLAVELPKHELFYSRTRRVGRRAQKSSTFLQGSNLRTKELGKL